jgi:hypothetical protein
VTYQPDPGTTLAAVEAIDSAQKAFTRQQVAYLVAVAYRSGLTHGQAYDIGELLATWADEHPEPPTREDRIAAEIARGGPALFTGGMPIPATYFPADPGRTPPRFPTLDEQASWLSAKDIAFCRRYARERYAPREGGRS